MNKKIHVIVEGRVQGVFFRYTTRQVANKIGITGWVKNTREGKVEVMAEGEETKLIEFIKFLEKGPKHAIVKNIEVEWGDYNEEFSKFSIMGW